LCAWQPVVPESRTAGVYGVRRPRWFLLLFAVSHRQEGKRCRNGVRVIVRGFCARTVEQADEADGRLRACSLSA